MNAATETPALPLCPVSARYTYHVVTSAACMPNKCWGIYKRAALLRVDRHERPASYTPKTIRAVRGVEIVSLQDKLNVGTTDRCAYKQALAFLESLRADEIARDSATLAD